MRILFILACLAIAFLAGPQALGWTAFYVLVGMAVGLALFLAAIWYDARP